MIYIKRDITVYGPYSESEAFDHFKAGQLLQSDLASIPEHTKQFNQSYMNIKAKIIVPLLALTLPVITNADSVIISPARPVPGAATANVPQARTNSANGTGKTPGEARAQAEQRMYKFSNVQVVKVFNYGSAQTGYACTITFTSK